ncbi:MAG: hypothetical protein AVO34_13745 [Firmicutes bacterium ML8_F2]|jgi:hypothetical protein|nr:MAG: hypothetical protein AVO34_13745 [Firmicutes bacterium ML8_F2]
MAASDAVKTLRSTIEKYLKESFGSYLKDDRNNYILQAGSARVFIIPVDWIKEQTIVRVVSVLNRGAPITGELTKFLAYENIKVVFGKFSLDPDRQAILFEHVLLGDFLNRKELEVAVKSVAFIADKYDDEIKAQFGGKKYGEQ